MLLTLSIVHLFLGHTEVLKIKNITNIIIIFIATMLIVLILFGPEAIAILGGSKYKDAIWVVPPVAGSLLFLFLSQLCINVMFYFQNMN